MDDATRNKLVRMVAIKIMRDSIPHLPAGAAAPSTPWWTQAEEIVDIVVPYVKESILGNV